ncbi:hypothetical protein MMC30_000173 [Trapelia coarctata]|nr:hypothetical protein [Trapelia coarctata]
MRRFYQQHWEHAPTPTIAAVPTLKATRRDPAPFQHWLTPNGYYAADEMPDDEYKAHMSSRPVASKWCVYRNPLPASTAITKLTKIMYQQGIDLSKHGFSDSKILAINSIMSNHEKSYAVDVAHEYPRVSLVDAVTAYQSADVYTNMTSITKSTKAFIARKQQIEQGKMCAAEAKSFKNKAIMLDIFSVGVAAIGINSAANVWKRLERLRQKDKKAEAKFQENVKEKKSILA